MECWRCGVTFTLNVKKYKEGAPCPDCVEDDPGQWMRSRTKPGRISEAERQRRETVVKTQYDLGKLDKEIAEAVGLSVSTVGIYRRSLGLPAHYRPDKHLWKDKDAQIEHAKHMVEKRKSVGRGKRPFNFEGSGPRW